MPVSGEDLRLDEMLRILDAASVLRKEREHASLALEVDETRRLLRERLLEAARVSGERVSEAEVDAAVARYYATLHEFDPPGRGFQRALAHLYVRRNLVAALAGGAVLWCAAIWWLFLASSGPFSSAGRIQRTLDKSYAPIAKAWSQLPALAIEPEVDREIEELWARANQLRDSKQVDSLAALAKDFEQLDKQLRAAYQVFVVSEPGQRSGVIKEENEYGQISGHYLIVEALDADGRPVRLGVRDSEESRIQFVSRWGELVDQAVYERIAADKRADGIVDERLFAEKVRGKRNIDVRMQDGSGNPLTLQRQITSWE